MDLLPLKQYLKTKTEANALLSLLESLDKELYKKDFNLQNSLDKLYSYEEKTSIEKILKASKINTTDAESLQKFIRSLMDEISKLPVIHIILALPFGEKTINSIHDWFYTNYKRVVLLDITIDNSILAGSVISYGGRANDYSLASKIEASSF